LIDYNLNFATLNVNTKFLMKIIETFPLLQMESLPRPGGVGIFYALSYSSANIKLTAIVTGVSQINE
jgi:hypothetical protein